MDRIAPASLDSLTSVNDSFVPVDPGDVIAGAPETRTTVLATTDGPAEFGVWELHGGSVCDIEVDEMFVVIAGGARLTVNGAAPRDIAAGDIVELRAGDATVWQVDDLLRKIYFTPREN